MESSAVHAALNILDQHSPIDSSFIKSRLQEVLFKETQSLDLVAKTIPTNAHLLVDAMLTTSGRVVFSGTGKSGIVAKKLVATCSSLGIPSFFLHPHEALHGDLGMVTNNDLFIALSKSATGTELSIIVTALKLIGARTALISCCNGTLSREVDIAITLPFVAEACELNLAPTSSSTITMAFGDALAVVVSSLKNFSRSDFARYHPAGALGKELSLQVGSLMYKAPSLPLIRPDTIFTDFITTISHHKMGIGIVVDSNHTLLGIITDGDLRRACLRGATVFTATAMDVMTQNPKTISQGDLATTALGIMETHNITTLVVTQDKQPIGVLHIHEIIKAGIKNL